MATGQIGSIGHQSLRQKPMRTATECESNQANPIDSRAIPLLPTIKLNPKVTLLYNHGAHLRW